MEALETLDKGGFTVEIFAEEDSESPREWDNLGTMLCFHKRYNLGDSNSYNSDDYDGWDSFFEQIRKDHDIFAFLPIYMMDHSGLSIRTNPSSFLQCDPQMFDWNKLGFIFVSREKAEKEFGELSEETREKCINILESEVKIYNQFLNGEIYSYDITCANGETVDSCGGFYGDDIYRGIEESLEHLNSL